MGHREKGGALDFARVCEMWGGAKNYGSGKIGNRESEKNSLPPQPNVENEKTGHKVASRVEGSRTVEKKREKQTGGEKCEKGGKVGAKNEKKKANDAIVEIDSAKRPTGPSRGGLGEGVFSDSGSQQK